MLIKKTNSALITLFNVTFILGLSSCSALGEKANNQPQAKYQYPHQCTIKGQLVNHYITAKVPLTVDELQVLKSTLQENMGLDYNSCKFVGDLNVINKNHLSR
jgi:hypothetical protein